MTCIKTQRPVVNGKRKRLTVACNNFFGLINDQYGRKANRHNYDMGATWAYGLLGPDLKNSSMAQTNTPSAERAGFTYGWNGQNRPDTIFLTNRFNGDEWIRGHLINGAWGGSGASWKNLTPLTKTANSNHETIEKQMNNFLYRSNSYDFKKSNDVAPFWYGIQYLVECSRAPFADNTVDVPTNLYAYAPEFIRVTWRAVQIAKPTNMPTNVQAPQVLQFIANAVLNPVPRLPFTIPNFPGNLRYNGALPAGAAFSAAPVYNSGMQLVAAQNNGFDGCCEIHQTA